MAIAVTCPTCHTRFNVSEKFAGKKGPCPKCKAPITIPSVKEQIKIHEREHEGTRGASGQLVLKPIEREKVRFRPLAIALGALPVLGVFIVAWLLRREGNVDEAFLEFQMLMAGIGAVLLGPPLAIGGYSFLRNDELEPYRGTALLIRGLICGLVYAALWGVYAYVPAEYHSTDTPEDMYMTAMVIVAFLACGAGVAFASLDLDIGSGFFHYLLYFVACVACRWLLGWRVV